MIITITATTNLRVSISNGQRNIVLNVCRQKQIMAESMFILTSVSLSVKKKWKIWNKMRATDPEYALAMKNADTAKVWQLENLFELQAEEIAIREWLLA